MQLKTGTLCVQNLHSDRYHQIMIWLEILHRSTNIHFTCRIDLFLSPNQRCRRT